MERKVSLKTTLKVVNRLRGALDMPVLAELPKGKCRSISHCPLAKALGATVRENTIKYSDINKADTIARIIRKGRCGKYIWMPQTLSSFVVQFDHGDFPELQTR